MLLVSDVIVASDTVLQEHERKSALDLALEICWQCLKKDCVSLRLGQIFLLFGVEYLRFMLD